jgi:energy-coupling factor transporter ATP-binding protein EcfA2
METISVRNLEFTYPLSSSKALDKMSFDVDQSEFIVVCGKSGCGKSTLLKQLKKNLIPYGKMSGDVLYYGKDVSELDDRTSAAEIGFVQQNPDNQIVTDKVWHELAFGLESLGFNNSAIKRRVAEMASYFDIQGWFRKDVNQLSGGQKQLLNLASIMAMQPKLLILDEPTSQLDPIAASEFLRTIYKINRDLGVTVIISEHRLEELFPMADKVMVIDKGKIIGYDTPSKIGKLLKGEEKNEKHPMFYGLPSVMRIFADGINGSNSPLTIREGRLWMEEHLGRPQKKDIITSVPKIKTRETKTNNSAIHLKDIWYKYNKESGDVLRGVNLEIEKGTWYGLMGGNGVGKSTTLKCISGVLKPQRGKVTVNGSLSMLPQNPQALFTEITVEEELAEALYYTKINDAEKVRRVEEMMTLMEIVHLRKANPYDLSGGEQQRLALGKILLLEPEILLLDEPTKGLDPFFKITLAKILRGIVEEGMTIFMVSHDIEFCAEYVDQCAMFFDGDIMSSGTTKEFFSGNSFYTTTANKIAREWQPEAITCQEVSNWLRTMI